LIVVLTFTLGILLIFAIDYYSTPGTSPPNVPTIAAMNCSYSKKICFFSLNNPPSDSSTTIIKGVITNATNGVAISSVVSPPPIPAGKITNVTISVPSYVKMNSTLGFEFVFANGSMITGTVSVD
jgi:hypothetical protein